MFAQLLPALHFALVSHTRCAAHGELVHGSLDEHASAAQHDRAELANPEGADDHEHCALVHLLPNSGDVDAVLYDTAIASRHPRVAQGAQRAAEHRAIALLDEAPKASPPQS